jgi:hypothetical protein
MARRSETWRLRVRSSRELTCEELELLATTDLAVEHGHLARAHRALFAIAEDESFGRSWPAAVLILVHVRLLGLADLAPTTLVDVALAPRMHTAVATRRKCA